MWLRMWVRGITIMHHRAYKLGKARTFSTPASLFGRVNHEETARDILWIRVY